jgi:hypothetical protein
MFDWTYKLWVETPVIAQQLDINGKPLGNAVNMGGDFISQTNCGLIIDDFQKYLPAVRFTPSISDNELEQGTKGAWLYKWEIVTSQPNYLELVTNNYHWWMIAGFPGQGEPLQAEALYRAKNQPYGQGCPGYWGEVPSNPLVPIWVPCTLGTMPSSFEPGGSPKPFAGNLDAAKSQVQTMLAAVTRIAG